MCQNREKIIPLGKSLERGSKCSETLQKGVKVNNLKARQYQRFIFLLYQTLYIVCSFSYRSAQDLTPMCEGLIYC